GGVAAVAVVGGASHSHAGETARYGVAGAVCGAATFGRTRADNMVQYVTDERVCSILAGTLLAETFAAGSAGSRGDGIGGGHCLSTTFADWRTAVTIATF